MTNSLHQLYGLHPEPNRLLRPWPRINPPDLAPPPKPLVMGPLTAAGEGRPAMARVQTRWQTSAKPTFPIRPASDPVRQAADNERRGMTLLALVVCVSVSVALLGFGLQVLQ